MKVHAYIWTLLLLAAAITGCRDVDDRLDKIISDHLEFTETQVILSSAGRTESIVVTSDLSWSLEGDVEWCTVSPTRGPAGTSTIYFTSVPNTEYDDRSVNYTLVAGEKRTVLTVNQKKKDEIIFDKDKFDQIPMEGGEIEVAMSANVDYTIDFPEGAGDWIQHLAPGTRGTRGLERKTERFRISATDEWDERMGLIVFIREDERTRDTVKVFQVQRDKILLTPSVIYPVLEGGEVLDVELRFNVDYDITVPTEYADWIFFSNDRPDVLKVWVAESLVERDGQIIITDRNNPGLSEVLHVFQVERDMVKFEETQLDVPQGGGTFTLDVLDNIDGDYDLYIPKYATWIREAPTTRALTSSTVSIIVDENPEAMIPRGAKLYLKGVGKRNGDKVFMSVAIQVAQAGRPLILKDTTILQQIQYEMGLVHNNWPGGPNNLNYAGLNYNFYLTWVATTLNMPSSATYTKTTELPELVGDLKTLTEMTLGGHLSGNIPVSIGSLPLLNKLTIESVKTGSAGFNGLPPELGGLENLKTLMINHDFSGKGLDLTTILDFIGDLPNLESLTIKNCNYGEKMPESWRNLTKLKTLTLEGTGFVDLDPISDMVSLTTLNIQKDAIVDLPDLGRLTQLNSVTLSNNTEFTSIPASLMRVNSLTTLTIANSRIERLPDDWSALVNLTALNLSTTTASEYKIQGTLPASMGYMTKLKTFNVNYNALEGQIPAEFGNFTALTAFNILGNRFSSIARGVLPKWTSLTGLVLSENAFTELPEDIVEMTWLTSLTAINNEFTGELPANIGNLEKLTKLDLSRDTARDFQSPGLGGFIPASITNLKKMTLLNLSGNNFIGPIPANIDEMTALYNIILNDNQLSGEIPLALTKLPNTGFKYIFLQNNNLSGYIPDAFRNLYKLYRLDLRNNNLQGTVPSGLVMGDDNLFSDKGSILHLSGNRLTGVVPAELEEKMNVTHTVTWQILEQQPGYGLTLPPK